MFTISNTQAISSQLQLQQANKILIHGIRIQEDTRRRLVWIATGSKLFGDDGPLAIEITNGNTWPDPTVYGELWAKYDPNLGGTMTGTSGLRLGGAR